MKILSLDQASRVTGYCVFEDEKPVKYGTFSLTDQETGPRLTKFRNEILSLIKEHDIEYVIYEDIQLQQGQVGNVKTFKVLAEIYGVLTQLLDELHMPSQSVLAVQWRSTLGIKGRSRTEQKKATQQYVLTHYNIKASEDTCDAICIGLHYIASEQSAF